MAGVAGPIRRAASGTRCRGSSGSAPRPSRTSTVARSPRSAASWSAVVRGRWSTSKPSSTRSPMAAPRPSSAAWATRPGWAARTHPRAARDRPPSPVRLRSRRRRGTRRGTGIRVAERRVGAGRGEQFGDDEVAVDERVLVRRSPAERRVGAREVRVDAPGEEQTDTPLQPGGRRVLQRIAGLSVGVWWPWGIRRRHRPPSPVPSPWSSRSSRISVSSRAMSPSPRL